MRPDIPANDAGQTAEAPSMLDDITVLDLGDEPTALAGELLAELGARVIRVEDQAGDAIRLRGREANAVFNAGKLSVSIDPESDDGWARVRPLLAEVDVVIGPLAPSAAAGRFLDEVRAAGSPALVETVFRRNRPPEPATDLTVTAAGGLTWLCGESADPPNHPAGNLAWKQTSLAVAEAALALVTNRRRNGAGGHVVVSAQEAVTLTTLQTANGNIQHWHGLVPNRHAKPAAFTTVSSADGRWTSFTIHPPNWSRFVEWADLVLGGSGLDGPEWLDLNYVAANRPLVADVVERIASSLDQDELIEEGQRRGLLVLPVNDVEGVIGDRHLEARSFWVDVADADGPLMLPGSPFRSSLGRCRRGPAPQLGAHNHLLQAAAARSTDRPTTAATMTNEAEPKPSKRSELPLAGIRIADFGWAIAGPLSTRLLADLGADVIKIESDNRLDPIRYIGPQPPGEGSIDTNGVFNDCSANKRAVTVNLATEAGRDIVRRLIATADVVSANFTPDRLDRWGLDWQTLHDLRPGLVVANLAVMGTWGPDADWRSYGSGLVAMSGLAAHTGFDGTVPECLGTLHTDFTVPYFAACQILAALHHRDRTGEGAYLEMSQYESAVRLLDEELTSVLNGGPNPGRSNNRSPWLEPHGVYPASGDDRWVAVACRDQGEREALADAIGCDSPAALQTEAADALISSWTSSRSRDQVVAALRARGVPVSAVEDLGDHHRDSAMSELWADLELPAGVGAKVLYQPITWNGERLPVRPAPMWFEHTYDVLVDELGIDPGTFADLVDDGTLA